MPYPKPLPIPDPETRPFWEGTKRHQLLIQQCADCGTYRFYPRSLCPKCMSSSTRWVEASGRGKIYSFSIVYRPPSPAFQGDVPYNVAIIELEEGVRMMSNVLGCRNEDLRVDMPVEVVFEDITSEITLPKFRPVSQPR